MLYLVVMQAGYDALVPGMLITFGAPLPKGAKTVFTSTVAAAGP